MTSPAPDRAPCASVRQHEWVPTVEVVGVYPVVAAEPCHLVELIVHDGDGPFDVGAITQAAPARPRSDWQVPYDEKLLTADGDGVQHETGRSLDEPPSPPALTRLAFFLHYLDLDRPLLTPFGEVPLPPPVERPARLAALAYEAP
jgi:hypothetical protein